MIRINNLDKAHEQVSDLYKTENSLGIEMLFNFDKLIGNLKDHWIGEDSTIYINRLVDLYNKLQTFIDLNLSNTKQIMISIVTFQELRKANGGGGQVSDVASPNLDFIKNINKVETNKAYYVDPLITNDYVLLETVEEQLKEFNKKVELQATDLFNNWELGYNREDLKSGFDDIYLISEEAEKTVSDVKAELNTVITNTNLIME